MDATETKGSNSKRKLQESMNWICQSSNFYWETASLWQITMRTEMIKLTMDHIFPEKKKTQCRTAVDILLLSPTQHIIENEHKSI